MGRTMTMNAFPLKNRPYKFEIVPTVNAPMAAEMSARPGKDLDTK